VTDSVSCPTCLRDYIPLDRNAPRRCGVCIARRQRVILSLGISSGIVAAIVIALIVMPGSSEAKKPEPLPNGMRPTPVVQGPSDPNAITDMEKQVVASCDPKRITGLLELMNTEGKHRAAVRAGESFQKSCKRFQALDHDILYAREALEQWAEAETITDRLLHEDPNDNDYWWWRGKVRRHVGKHEGAIIDLRQSLAHSTSNSNGVQIDHLDKASTALERRCEAAFGLRWLAVIGVNLHSRAEAEMQEMYFGADCKKLDGTGEFSWKAEAISKPKGAAKIAGKPASVMIGRRLGTTLGRREVAEKLGLALGDTVEVMTPTGLGTGALAYATVEVGTAKAAEVPLVVVETLPEGVDAVLGLGFLWRFDVQLSDDGETFNATASRDE
jgi:hypothetical protein